MKRCGKCGTAKPLDEFHSDMSKPDGRHSRCKACQKICRATYYAANRDAAAEQMRAYRRANRDTVAERKRKYRAANREALAEQERDYRRANPHVKWEACYRERARRYGFEPVVESFTRADLIARYGDQCWHCGGDFDELDHYPIAVRDGGRHALDNVRPSCTPCNRGWKAGAA